MVIDIDLQNETATNAWYGKQKEWFLKRFDKHGKVYLQANYLFQYTIDLE